jgi:hypothetical protein
MDRELYALSSDRSAAFALRFLDTFTPGGSAAAVDYPVPEHANLSTHTFTQVEELLAHLEANTSEPYGVYWRAHRDAADVRMAMLFYTDDGFVILGLAVDESCEAAQMARLKAFADAEFTAAWDEQAPPRSAVEFRAMCAA